MTPSDTASDGPFVVSELLELEKGHFPPKLQLLYDNGRAIVIGSSALVIITATGQSVVLQSRDILSFRGPDPYAVIHLS